MPDNITFMSIPLNWRVPGAFVEVDHTKAVRGLPSMPHRILLLGQRLASGSVAAGVPTRVTRAADGVDYFGRGSQLAQMVAAALKVNSSTELWALALDDLPAGVKATGTLAITGTATEASTLYAYVGGGRVPFNVASGDAAATVATALAAAINANADLPATATAAAGTVTVTARHKGLTGNDIDLRVGYYQGEKSTAAGLTIAITAMASGAGNPDVTAAIAAMSTGSFYTIAMAWTDAANMAAMETELAGRWGGMDMRAGHVIGCLSGTFSGLTTIGSARNSPHSTLFGLKKCPTVPWVTAAQVAAAVEFSGANDPAIPFRGLRLPDVMAPAEADRFTNTERNLLMFDGISTIIFDVDGSAMVEQVLTTYQTNTFGLDDTSLLKLNSKWTSDYMRYVFRQAVVRDYPAHKLADDNVLGQISPGQKIATPRLIKNTLIGAASQLAAVGLLEDLEQFKRELVVVRSASDPNRVNAILPANIVNQFDVFAAAVQFIL